MHEYQDPCQNRLVASVQHRANMRRFVFSLPGSDNTMRTASQPGSRPSDGNSFAQASLGTALYYLGQQLEP
jgi:hypothetical protein